MEAALAAYERALFPRAAENAADAAELQELLFDDDAPHGLIGLLTGKE